MAKKDLLRISAVSYINSLPFIYGIQKAGTLKNHHLSLDYPSKCAEKIEKGTADIGLAPVALLLKMPTARILPGYCIGANGPVKSVLLHSEVPLRQIRRIYLDYQSRTSVLLIRILCRYFWKIDPELVPAGAGFEKKIRGNVAGLIIGDRNFGLKGNFRHSTDLSGEWKRMTGLPFVFACWIAAKPIGRQKEKELQRALAFGLKHRMEALKKAHSRRLKGMPVGYLKRYIRYGFGQEEQKALRLFLQLGRKIVATR